MKKLEDYIHLYIGCRVWDPVNKSEYIIDYAFLRSRWDDEECRFHNGLKLILRPLESMTEKEGEELYSGMTGSYFVEIPVKDDVAEINISPFQVQYLLSKGFDLFGLIPAGLAIKREG